MFDALAGGKIDICISTEITLEYKEILQRKTNIQVAENVMEFLKVNPHVIQTEIYFRFNLIQKDTDDNKFVDCAISGDTDYIISNDRHFQILKTSEFPKVNIVTLSEFEAIYKF